MMITMMIVITMMMMIATMIMMIMIRTLEEAVNLWKYKNSDVKRKSDQFLT